MAMLAAKGRQQRRTAILPVRETGSFRRRSIREVVGIYRALTMGDALLPPALLLLFDRDGRDGRDGREIEDAIRESQGKIRFLGRRMFENHLLNAQALSNLLNENGKEFGIATASESVHAWITANGERFMDKSDSSAVWTEAWHNRVNAAGLIDALFGELSEQRLSYRKVVDMPRLTILVDESDSTGTNELPRLIADVLR